MATPKELRQEAPGVKCGRNHNWSGVVVAKGDTAADAATAKQNAFNAAKTAATTYYDDDKRKVCPDTCAGGTPGATNPQSTDALKFAAQNPRTLQWTGFAAVFWTVKRRCPGQGQQEQLTLPQTATKEVTEPDDVQSLQPACGKRIVYSGAVIGCAYNADMNDAKDAAKTAAKTRADSLVTTFRQKTCPNNCQGGTQLGTVQQAVDVHHVELLQVTNTPYVAYAVAFFDVGLACPAAGGGGGGGGSEDIRRR